jgi:hypothetical protein
MVARVLPEAVPSLAAGDVMVVAGRAMRVVAFYGQTDTTWLVHLTV